MANSKNTVFGIFLQSIGLYAENFLSFTKYMFFPVFGQLIGTLLCFAPVFYFTSNVEKLRIDYPFLEDPSKALITVLVLTLPGLFILLKAFWDYLVAYGAINSMTENLLKSGKVYDFKAHTQTVTQRVPVFIGIWLLLAPFNILASIPFFMIICLIILIFFILVFQAFTFEEKLSPIGCFKRSFNLVKNHFWSTLSLTIFIGALCYVFIPQIIGFVSKDFIPIMAHWILPWVEQIPIENLNTALVSLKFPNFTHADLAIMFVASTISTLIIEFTLPVRSICWTLWYKELSKIHDKKPAKKKTNV